MRTVVAALNDAFAGVPHTMFCVKDADGRYLAINQAFAERAGRRRDHVLGRTAADLFPADLVDTYEAQDARLLATGEAIRNELEMILRPDGSRGWYVTSKTLLRDEHGDDRWASSSSATTCTPRARRCPATGTTPACRPPSTSPAAATPSR